MASVEPIFRMHLAKEPANLNPQKQKTAAAGYLIGNLYRNIFNYDDKKGLVPELGESCKFKSPTLLECQLKKDLKWSDGSPLTSADFLRSYTKLLDAKQQAPRADLLFQIKNAAEIYQGLKKPLGITAPDPITLRFELLKPDPEFIYALANVVLSPTKDSSEVFSGPYQLDHWTKGAKIRLKKNSFYQGGETTRPAIEFVFVNEDAVALNLYEKGELDLLRRLPTLFIPGSKTRADFHSIPVTRFDYFGFGPSLTEQKEFRQALAHSLDYRELQKIFSSKGAPGCAGVPDEWFESSPPCLQYDLKLAARNWAKVPDAIQKKTYDLAYSSLGLEDNRRATEWMQAQWRKLGAKINPVSHEHKIFLSELEARSLPLYREGVSPDRPTCLSALETLRDKAKFHHPDFDKIILKMKQFDSLGDSNSNQKKNCTLAVQTLLDQAILIPTGAYDISMLIRADFTGWRFNRSGQLDLSWLSYRKKVR